MALASQIGSLFRNLLRKRQVEQQLDEEVRSYVQMLADEKMAQCATAAEARRAAQIEMGGIDQVKQSVRDHRAGSSIESLWQDVRFGMRQLLRSPGFTLTALVTLALSIGANTAIFSIVNVLMLKSLPYPNPERMGTIYTRFTGRGASDERHNINGEQWELLRDNVPALISAVSGGTPGVNLEAGSAVRYVADGRVSAHYFDVLGIQPMLGRTFTEDEDRPHGPPAVILGNGLWRTLFSSDAAILGKPIRLKGEPFTVIGVLPPDAITPANADLYTALQPSRNGEGSGTNFDAFTRLRDSATWQEADAEINRAWTTREHRYEKSDDPNATVSYHSVPLQGGQAAELRPQALALMLAAGFILLIACANLAGLTLVRMMRRSAEVATRMALGASRWQIQRQFWIENLLLALAGGAAGIGMGFLALRGLLILLPKHFLPVAHVPLDGRVLTFALAVSLFTSILFGMLPALGARKVDLRSSITSRSVVGTGHRRLRQVLIAGEVALTVVLLAAAGLIVRTLVHLETLPPGFNPNGVIAAKASLDDARYHDQKTFLQLLDESTAAMRKIPGVRNAAVGLSLPYERVLNDGVTIHGGPDDGHQVGTDVVYVTPWYFETLEIPLAAGRSFLPSDGPNDAPVAVINSTFARKFFPGVNPVGLRLDKGVQIVGVAADVPISSGLNPIAPLMSEETMYIPAAQVDPRLLALVHTWFQPSWIVRSASPVEGLTEQMQKALTSVAPGLPFSGFYSMRDVQATTLSKQRVETALLSTMALLALLLSAVGIFALVSSIVSQKTREIGIRIALGSSIRRAMFHVGSSGLMASLLGMLLGLALAAGVLRVMRSVLYGVDIYDAPSLIAILAVLVLVTLGATVLPTMRVGRIEPAKTLREE